MKTGFMTISDKRKKANILVVGCFQKEGIGRNLSSLEPAFAEEAKAAVKAGRFTARFGQVLSSFRTCHNEADEIVLLGLGNKKNYTPLRFKKLCGQISSMYKASYVQTLRIVAESFVGGKISINEAGWLLRQTIELGQYRFDKYKHSAAKKKPESSKSLEILTARKPAESFREKVTQARSVAEGTLLARDLINEPANVLNPPKMAEIARRLAAAKKLQCRIMGPAELRRLKMGGILGVNQGSVKPPAMIILEYGNRFKSKGTICLVGKGVCFDTGGLSIKPARGMEKMKYDMSGGAAVIGAMRALPDVGLKRHVVGIVPAVENNVAVDPQRPGDIIRMHNGKTVEVLNTDAEGRLILADALSYCARYKPKAIIDAATLTGMCVATFGDQAIGLMGNNRALLDRIKKAGEATGERCWELPMWDEYNDQIKGHHSDLYNIGGPYGGTITAAKFLEHFVPAKTAWAHLDIAGVAWAESNRYDCVKGGTGAAVRLFVNLLMNWK